MHLAKWIRKNSKKIMVFVVIFSMVSFVIGYTGLQIFFSFFGGGGREVVATYGDDQKIRARDYLAAQGELGLLRTLRADIVLSQGNQGLAGPLTAYLLFPDSQAVGDLPAQLKQAAQQGQVPVSVAVIEDFFNERTQPEMTWLLLKEEARKAGAVMSDAAAQKILAQILPQLSPDQDAAAALQAIIAQTHTTEAQVVRTFADLLGVMFYNEAVLDTQAVTTGQIQNAVARAQEKFDAEAVRIPAEWFVSSTQQVPQEELNAQFEKYKSIPAGQIAADNPFGFGYKLPHRVRLEYMAVMVDDIKARIEAPTAEQMEEYYSRNLDRFKYEEPVDAAKPDGEKVSKTRSFAESLPQIRRILEEERITRLGNQFFNDAKSAIESGFGEINVDTAEVAQLQAAAGDYDKTATELSARHKIAAVTGKTGLLGAADFAQDNLLRGFRLPMGNAAAPLADIALNVRIDPKDTQRRIGMPNLRPWENIGPMSGGYFDQDKGQFVRVMAMVRVIGAEESVVPEAIGVTYDKRGMVLRPLTMTEEAAAAFSLADKVATDVRLVKAMDAAQAKAAALAALAKEKGWDEALTAFNTDLKAINAAAVAAVEPMRQQNRLQGAEAEMLRRSLTSNPASAAYFQSRLKTNALNEKLYALLPAGQPTTGTIFEVVAAPAMEAAYAVKSVTLAPATEKDYLDNKAMTAFRIGRMASMDLAFQQLKPKHLFARMNYHSKQDDILIEKPAPIQIPDEF